MENAFYRPFEVLKKLVEDGKLSISEKTADDFTLDLCLPDEASDDEIFQAAMKDVKPLGWSARPLPPHRPINIENRDDSEKAALRLLRAFVESGKIDLTWSEEYVEKQVQPAAAGRWLLEDLHRGRFSVQAHLDLHGMNLKEARGAVEKFIREAIRQGIGCVRIVHGRGQHSVSKRAVLKEHVQRWLTTRRMSRYVVAFTSARLCDGGGGALYVLLRRAR